MKSYNDFMNEISIIEMAISIGYEQDNKKGHKWPVLINKFTNDKIMIGKSDSLNKQRYYNLKNDQDHGNLIEFIKNRLKSDFNLNNDLAEYININKVLNDFQNTPFVMDDFQKTFLINNESVPFTTGGLTHNLMDYSYLLSRNIRRDIIKSKEFNGRIFNHEKNGILNIAFPFYDIDEKIICLEKKNYNYKQMVAGSDRSNSVWHSNIPDVLDKIIITESVIDAISYHQLKPTTNTLYVSIGGSLSVNQIPVIKNLKNKSIIRDDFLFVSAMDNDKDGIKYDVKLNDWLKPDRLVIDKPILKDYNEDLVKSFEKKSSQSRSFKW